MDVAGRVGKAQQQRLGKVVRACGASLGEWILWKGQWQPLEVYEEVLYGE